MCAGVLTFAPDGLDPDAVMARAVILAADDLAYLDQTTERLQRNLHSVLQLLDSRREIFAHRAREHARDVRIGKLELFAVTRKLPLADSKTTGEEAPKDVKLLPPPSDSGSKSEDENE